MPWTNCIVLLYTVHGEQYQTNGMTAIAYSIRGWKKHLSISTFYRVNVRNAPLFAGIVDTIVLSVRLIDSFFYPAINLLSPGQWIALKFSANWTRCRHHCRCRINTGDSPAPTKGTSTTYREQKLNKLFWVRRARRTFLPNTLYLNNNNHSFLLLMKSGNWRKAKNNALTHTHRLGTFFFCFFSVQMVYYSCELESADFEKLGSTFVYCSFPHSIRILLASTFFHLNISRSLFELGFFLRSYLFRLHLILYC